MGFFDKIKRGFGHVGDGLRRVGQFVKDRVIPIGRTVVRGTKKVGDFLLHSDIAKGVTNTLEMVPLFQGANRVREGVGNALKSSASVGDAVLGFGEKVSNTIAQDGVRAIAKAPDLIREGKGVAKNIQFEAMKRKKDHFGTKRPDGTQKKIFVTR